MAVTETTLQWLRYAETNLRDIAAKMAEEPDPTVRVLAAHALRYLEQAGKDVDAALDEAAGAWVEERYALTPAGAAVLVAAGLARDRATLEAGRPRTPPFPPEAWETRPAAAEPSSLDRLGRQAPPLLDRDSGRRPAARPRQRSSPSRRKPCRVPGAPLRARVERGP